MSKDWVADIANMHAKFKVSETVAKMDRSMLLRFLEFRLSCIREELEESEEAYLDSDSEEIVDGIIDTIVFAIGTLDAFGIDSHKAWDEVLKKNMQKRPGIKRGRPNPFGFPDLVKPEGWTPPNHEGNHGVLDDIFKGEIK